MIMDCDDFTVFTNAMELHYIDMKAFAKAVNEADSIIINDTEEMMFAKWLSIITQKEIANKAIIENACEEDEIYFYNKERADDRRIMEQQAAEIEKLRKEVEVLRATQNT